MRTKIQYEWCIEHENKNGDIIDLDFADKLTEYGASSFKINRGCIKATLHLVRNEYTDDEFIDRMYAYPNADGVLEFGDWYPADDPTETMMSWHGYPNIAVPKKLQEEYSRHRRTAGVK
tara:strand:+ start:393 stop:749 length:357 start_codon:yes stop_codon:yes gene_type:complete